MASLFDPQGSAAPLTVKAKIRNRELDIKGLAWNDPVRGEDRIWWEQWFKTLRQLKHLEFSRCLFPNEEMIVRRELHTFCDASKEAYGAVVYVRSVFKNDQVTVRQVKAGTKLAPKKTLSIPKLEIERSTASGSACKFCSRGANPKDGSSLLLDRQ